MEMSETVTEIVLIYFDTIFRLADGESRPAEDTPSAAEMQFFGNLNAIGQVDVANPDQVKHREVCQR